MHVRSFFPPSAFYGTVSKKWYIICSSDGDGWVEVDREYSRSELDKMWQKITYLSNTVKTPPIAYKQYEVPGSKGATYTVTADNGLWLCNCMAFAYGRGKDCKHIVATKQHI